MSLAPLLEPAVRLMNRLRYAQKFLFMGSALGVLVILVVVMLAREIVHDVADTRDEIGGVTMIGALDGATRAIEDHGALASRARAGDASLGGRLASQADAVARALAAADVALSPTLRGAVEWQRIQDQWRALASAPSAPTGGDADEPGETSGHAQLIEALSAFRVDVADATQLSLDPELPTYYLMSVSTLRAPDAIEAMTRVRDLGVRALMTRGLDLDDKLALAVALADAHQTADALEADLGKVGLHVESLRPAVAEATSRTFPALERLRATAGRDLLHDRFEIAPDAFAAEVGQVIAGLDELTDRAVRPTLTALLEARSDAGQRTLWWTLGATVALGAALLYLSLGLYLSIRRGVSVLTKGAHDVADGNLTARFDALGRDEIGFAATKFEGMVERLREAVAGVRTEAESMTSVSVELAATSDDLAASSARARELAGRAASATESASHDSDAVARGHEELGIAAREVAANAQKASAIASEAVALGDTARERMHSLHAASGSIVSVIQTVEQIAAKTNLLALNASIECVHAGEHGRAFAVVANQVKELARQSTQAARQIGADIARVQQEVVHVNDAIGQMAQTLGTINEYQSSTAAAIEEQRATIDTLTETLHRVATAGAQTLESARAVAGTMDGAAQATRGVAGSAAKLNRLTGKVRERLGHFRIA